MDLIARCRRQKVPVFFKQWGGARPHSGGRTINGREYDQYPIIKRYNPLKDASFDAAAFAERKPRIRRVQTAGIKNARRRQNPCPA